MAQAEIVDPGQYIPEALGVAWCEFYGTKDGNTVKINVTQRSMKGSEDALRKLMETIRVAADEYNMKPYPVHHHHKPAPAAIAPEPERVDTQQPKVVSSAPVTEEDTEQTETCDATELFANTSEGKVYWKVRCGRWQQYGVTVWPEVLEAAGLTDLDPGNTYDLNGWDAKVLLVVSSKTGNLTPKKVVSLSNSDAPF